MMEFPLRGGGAIPYTVITLTDFREIWAPKIIPPQWWTAAFALKIVEVNPSTNFSQLEQGTIIGELALSNILAGPRISRKTLQALAISHGLKCDKHYKTFDELMISLAQHSSAGCRDPCQKVNKFEVMAYSALDKAAKRQARYKSLVQERIQIYQIQEAKRTEQSSVALPSTRAEIDRAAVMKRMISDWCDSNSSKVLAETICVSCGTTVLKGTSVVVSENQCALGCLRNPGVAVHPRRTSADLGGPILEPLLFPREETDKLNGMLRFCSDCNKAVRLGRRPEFAPANGLWVGDVPEHLPKLSFAEKLLIAKERHNICVVQVNQRTRQRRMEANAVCFGHPISRVYEVLPPTPEELEEVLVVTFIGNINPSENDIKLTPFCVRRSVVMKWLNFLKLNHPGYANIGISSDNLMRYEDGKIPVSYAFVETKHLNFADLPTHAPGDSYEGITSFSDGNACAFAVSGLTEASIDTMTADQRRQAALKQLREGKALAIGHAALPTNTYYNSAMWVDAFPWLFPFGRGGLENEYLLSSTESAKRKITLGLARHMRFLLMYWDQRFARDEHFMYIAHNVLQRRVASRTSYAKVKKRGFERTAYLMDTVKQETLEAMLASMEKSKTNYVKAQSQDEENCIELLRHIEDAGFALDGSNASRKRYRNELRSLMMYAGAPSWFITFTPSDTGSPIFLHMAGETVNLNEYCPVPMRYSDRMKTVAERPVAGARFFDHTVKLFLKVILGAGYEDKQGLFGKLRSYYGTVEEQARKTLHLHCLIWIENALSPQEVRDKLMKEFNASAQPFTDEYVSNLEECSKGEFSQGDECDVRDQMELRKEILQSGRCRDCAGGKRLECACPERSCAPHWNRETECLPQLPAKLLSDDPEDWVAAFQQIQREADFIVYESNRHKHMPGKDHACGWPKRDCKARFPRTLHEKTTINEDGHVDLKQLEPDINTYNPYLSWMLRCNTDVSALKSGTTLKAILWYVTDYISKSSLKTNVMFNTIQLVFKRMREGSMPPTARGVLVKFVNAINIKQELGGPQIAAYLLGNGDVYTDCKFRPFFWKTYVREISQSWKSSERTSQSPNPNEDSHHGYDQASALTAATIADATEKLDDDVGGVTGLLASAEDGSIAFLSVIDDYTMRNAHLRNICLYDFIRCVKKDRGKYPAKRNKYHGTTEEAFSFVASYVDSTTRDNMPIAFSFNADHAQCQTHHLTLLPPSDHAIPNFIGPSLPRKDSGDWEEYCLTMLTFFKAFTDKDDLKERNETWASAFERHQFSVRAEDAMHHFHLLHECADAKDDLYALRKANLAGSSHYRGLVEEETEGEEWDMLINEGETPDAPYDDTSLGPASLRKANLMSVARCGFQAWAMESTLNLPDTPALPIDVEDLSLKHWKTIVQDSRTAKLAGMANSNGLQRTGPQAHTHREKNTFGANEEVVEVDAHLLSTLDAISFEKFSSGHELLLTHIIQKRTLYDDQERAFRLIGNHIRDGGDQLLMYIGGMAGSGKSQVLHALMDLFTARKERHRIRVCAPTGAAAVLIDGQTYHYLLGFRDRGLDDISAKSAYDRKVAENLRGVDYFFLDEISMTSCADMDKICEAIKKIRGSDGGIAGGMNMITAGDFGQLEPVGSASLFAPHVGLYANKAKSSKEQKAASGKAIWHQFTTVVLCKQNMRRDARDRPFYDLLARCRYGLCTMADVALLRTRIAPLSNAVTNVSDFRHVSIVTNKNTVKDAYNEAGTRELSEKVPQFIFHSDDMRKGVNAVPHGRKPLHRLTKAVQTAIWALPPSSSEQLPGKLRLCVGLPILLKKNQAVELGITNGAEAIVVGWKSREFIKGVSTVDVVFAQLVSPGIATQIPGLPPNIVPIHAETISVTVICPDDSKLAISRTQVPILPNFAMTDYACQGRTRPFNVIDLKDCTKHQSAYVMLSRGQSLSKLCIIQDFDPTCLMSGTTRSLLREFQDLEVLNDITRMRLDGVLPSSIKGTVRNDLIQSYQRYYGHLRKPEGTDESLPWPTDLYGNPSEDMPALNIDKASPKRQRSLSCTMASNKRPTIHEHGKELQRTLHLSNRRVLIGASWHDNSCAYDCLTTALFVLKQAHDIRQDMYAIWDASRHTRALEPQDNSNMFEVSYLNNLRDKLRYNLQQADSELREDLVSVFRVANHIFPAQHTSHNICLNCKSDIWTSLSFDSFISSKMSLPLSETDNTIQTCIQALLDSRICDRCQCPTRKEYTMLEICRKVLPVEIHCECPLWNTLTIDEEMTLTLSPTEKWKYSLIAVVYLGNDHFTAKFRMMTREGTNVYEYDGLRQMGTVVPSVANGWKLHEDKKAVCLVYVLTEKILR